MNRLQVLFHQSPEKQIVLGQLAYKNGLAYFELDKDFSASGINISPLNLKLSPQLQIAPRTPFNGLHGVFADSLPDGWGLLLMDRLFRQQGVSLNSITPLDRLAYMGDRTMGALSYLPDLGGHPSDTSADHQRLLSLNTLAKDALDIYQGSAIEVSEQLYIIGGSPGGARPKATIGLAGANAIAGAHDLPEGYEHWLVKFPTGNTQQAQAEGAVEYVFSLMAREAGIEFPATRLINQANGSGYFACKRFDRGIKSDTKKVINNSRVHMHSFAGLVNADFRIPDADYELLLKATSHITKSHADMVEVLRRMIFNIMAGNKDDHTKNFSFLMSADGRWNLSPAYDITFNTGINGHHSMSVMGHGQAIPKDAIQRIANLIPLSPTKVDLIIQEVAEALSQWPALAKDYGIPKDMIHEINGFIEGERVRLG